MSSTVIATSAALGTAVCYAGSIVLQFTAASNVEPAASRRPRDVGAFMWRTVTRPLWLLSLVTDVGGIGLQGVALSEGSLALVQPLLVTSLVFALPLDAAVHGSRPGARQLTSALLTAAGLALFTSLASPSGDDPVSIGEGLQMFGSLAVAVLVLALVAGRRETGVARAALLGVAAGLLFAGTGAMLKLTAEDLRDHGFFGTLTSWHVWGLAVVGVAGVVVEQLAYSAGPLAASLPGITVADPIAAVMMAVAFFGDEIGVSSWGRVWLSVGLLAMSVGAVDLARDEGRQRERRQAALDAAQGHAAPA